jgi:hypothetical protein
MALDREGVGVAGSPTKADRSFVDLLSDLVDETGLLLRQEVALLTAELGEKFSRASQGGIVLAAGAMIAFSGWLVLLSAAVLGLAIVLPVWLAALIVAVLALLIGGICLLVGRARLAARSLVPGRTLRSLREDQAWLRERVQGQ